MPLLLTAWQFFPKRQTSQSHTWPHLRALAFGNRQLYVCLFASSKHDSKEYSHSADRYVVSYLASMKKLHTLITYSVLCHALTLSSQLNHNAIFQATLLHHSLPDTPCPTVSQLWSLSTVSCHTHNISKDINVAHETPCTHSSPIAPLPKLMNILKQMPASSRGVSPRQLAAIPLPLKV